ncbi:TetR/AcrR family transcriptional regulator [Nocardiopsis lucentensis]|uniref:TetR/AcrR family transcriptional regulator n=1 Tax=Nocardiopsis lucentensis TaxID=53441 RepID=UPI00047682BC|nr:TetR/AcrR family transcriptional regulator [Nocardiopsis lucentensis]
MSASPAGGATAKGLRRRAEMLDAAERLLSASGGAQLTLRAVAQEAGVRLGHLQHYFPTRPDLLTALLDRVLATSLARITDRTGPSDEGTDPDAVVSGVLADHDDPSLVRLFTEVWALAAHDDDAAAVRSFYTHYTGHVADTIRHHVPELDEAGARARAEVFVMLVEGASLFRSGIAGNRTPGTDAVLRGALLGLLTGRGAT